MNRCVVLFVALSTIVVSSVVADVSRLPRVIISSPQRAQPTRVQSSRPPAPAPTPAAALDASKLAAVKAQVAKALPQSGLRTDKTLTGPLSLDVFHPAAKVGAVSGSLDMARGGVSGRSTPPSAFICLQSNFNGEVIVTLENARPDQTLLLDCALGNATSVQLYGPTVLEDVTLDEGHLLYGFRVPATGKVLVQMTLKTLKAGYQCAAVTTCTFHPVGT